MESMYLGLSKEQIEEIKRKKMERCPFVKIGVAVWTTMEKKRDYQYPDPLKGAVGVGPPPYQFGFIPFDNGILTGDNLSILVDKVREAFETVGVVIDLVFVPVEHGGCMDAGWHWSAFWECQGRTVGGPYRIDYFNYNFVKERVLEALPLMREEGDDIVFIDSRYSSPSGAS